MKIKKGKKNSLLTSLGLALSVGALCGVLVLSARVSSQETTKVLKASAFSVGLLDDATGKAPKEADKSGLTTDKYYEYEGLKIEIQENATVKYQINYYDAEKNFIHIGTFSENYDFSTPLLNVQNVKYVKIEIIPLDDEDNVVSWFEKSSYVNQLTITVNK